MRLTAPNVVLGVLLILGLPTMGARALVDPKPASSQSAPPTDGTSSLIQSPGYLIGPDDILHIQVWKEPELGATLPVRTDGKISLPLINDVQAAGMTPVELAGSITEKLKKYFDDPRVTVMVSQMTHQRVYVVGEVMSHGPMVLLPDMTVLQVLATSGLTQFANRKKIYVLRTTNGHEQKFPVNYKRLLKGDQMSQNIKLQPGDTIVVP